MSLGNTVVLFYTGRRETMRNSIEELWYGNIYPQGKLAIHNTEVKDILRLMDKNRSKLAEALTDEQKEVLQKYDDAVTEMNQVMEREIFTYAFRLGGRFMLDMLLDDSE